MADIYRRQNLAYQKRQAKLDFQNWLLTNFPGDEKTAIANLNAQISLSENPVPFEPNSFHLLLRPTFENITTFDDFNKKFLLPKRKNISESKKGATTTRKPTTEENNHFALNLYKAIVQYRYFQAKKLIYGEWEATTGGLYDFFRQRYPYLPASEKQTIMATLPIFARELAKNNTDREAIQEQCKNIVMKQQMGFWSALWARIKKTFTLGAFALTCLAALFIIPVAITNPAFEGAWALYTLGAMAMLYPLWRFFFSPSNYYHEGDNLFYEPTEVTYSTKISQAYDRQHWLSKLLIVLVGLATIVGLVYESRDFLTGIWQPTDVFKFPGGFSGLGTTALAYLPLLAVATFIVTAIYIINQKNSTEAPTSQPISLSGPKSVPSLSQANPSLLALASSSLQSLSSTSSDVSSSLPSSSVPSSSLPGMSSENSSAALKIPVISDSNTHQNKT